MSSDCPNVSMNLKLSPALQGLPERNILFPTFQLPLSKAEVMNQSSPFWYVLFPTGQRDRIRHVNSVPLHLSVLSLHRTPNCRRGDPGQTLCQLTCRPYTDGEEQGSGTAPFLLQLEVQTSCTALNKKVTTQNLRFLLRRWGTWGVLTHS